jgi:lipoteichoic acid synthase
MILRHRILEAWKLFSALFWKYWLLTFFIAAIVYLELVFRLWNLKGITLDFIFPVLFALSTGTVLFLSCSLFSTGVNRIMAVVLTSLLILSYGIQSIYFSIFHTPLSIYSLVGAGEALLLKDIVISAVLKNAAGVALLFVPLILLLGIGRKFSFFRIKPLSLCTLLVFGLVSYAVSILCVNLTGEGTISQYTLYYKASSPVLSVSRLGLMTTMRLDLKRLVLSIAQQGSAEAAIHTDESTNDHNSTGIPGFADTVAVSSRLHPIEKTDVPTPTPEPPKMETSPLETYNTMNIDFESLIANEKDPKLLTMHRYFSSVKATKKNQYTGIFEGNNLILITAESFSPYAISPELTPTLYKMVREGFGFKNFYNPLWGVSTSDGEYVACAGLIPKSGVWSFARSGKNSMPLAMGNQFKKLGYTTKAYHNHSHTYYKRNISHPNMGYDYKGIGNGLEVKKTWPESDLEMIEVTAGDFIGLQPFHTYYMTVSGHMNYNFAGNYIAKKNKSLVANLPFSDASKAYIACNLELEFAIKALVGKLEAAGIADKTVIAISADHYPYGLPRECIDELAGHKVENNFELYKSTFILWKKGMEPVTVDKPCSSLDIIPTLSNLFGLPFDSRLLAGSDILSDAPSLVIFSNRSWITDRAMYNSAANNVTFTDSTEKDGAYVKAVNKSVADKFEYSAKILETDYYSKVVPQEAQK